jgi:hypothetical protein
MNSETFQVYKHSGKFGVHGPILALLISIAVGLPLSIAYAYIVKWIPFVYVTFLATIGYGLVFGFIGGYFLRLGNVRNTSVAFLTGLLCGLAASYLSWSGYLFAIITEKTPVYWPDQIFRAMQILYEHGSWGMHNSGPVNGVPLVIVWVVEAALIIGFTTMTAFGMVAATPYCEVNQCWLDKEKKIDTLESFTDPEQLAAFKAGDLAPLSKAKPKISGAQVFARLTLKHSPKCDIFYTIRIQDVVIERDKNGNPKEKVKDITKDLMLPHAMFELIAKFENFTAPATSPEPHSTPASEKS